MSSLYDKWDDDNIDITWEDGNVLEEDVEEGAGEDAEEEGSDEDPFPEDDNLYSDAEIAQWERNRAGNSRIFLSNAKSEKVKFITVHPGGGEGVVIALDDDNKVVSPNAGELKGQTLSSAKSVGLDKLKEKGEKSEEKSSKGSKTDKKSSVDHSTKVDTTIYPDDSEEVKTLKLNVNKYEKRLKMYAMKKEEVQKRIDAGEEGAKAELGEWNRKEARVQKKLAGYKKKLGASGSSEPAKDSTKKPTSKESKESSSKSEESVQEPAKEQTKEPAKEVAKEPTKEPVKEPAPSLSSAKAAPEQVTPEKAKKPAKFKKVLSDDVVSNLIDTKFSSVVGNATIAKKNIADVDASIPLANEWMDSSQKKAMLNYTFNFYRQMNGMLTGRQPFPNKETKASVASLANAFESPSARTTKDVVLFRSMNGGHLPPNFGPGKAYTENSFVSTSSDHRVSGLWSKNNKAELMIVLPKGSKAINTGTLANGSEAETVLPPGTTFVCRSVQQRNNGTPVYVVEAHTPKHDSVTEQANKIQDTIKDLKKGKLPTTSSDGLHHFLKESVLNNPQTSDGYLHLDNGLAKPIPTKVPFNDAKKWVKDNQTNYTQTAKGAHSSFHADLNSLDSEDYKPYTGPSEVNGLTLNSDGVPFKPKSFSEMKMGELNNFIKTLNTQLPLVKGNPVAKASLNNLYDQALAQKTKLLKEAEANGVSLYPKEFQGFKVGSEGVPVLPMSMSNATSKQLTKYVTALKDYAPTVQDDEQTLKKILYSIKTAKAYINAKKSGDLWAI